MPKKLLPLLKEKTPKIKKLKKLLKRTPPEDQKQPRDRNFSPNLLLPIETKSLLMKASPKIARTSRALAIVTLVVYTVFFAANFLMQSLINSRVEIRDDYLAHIESNKDIDVQVKELSKAVDLYKSVKGEKRNILESLEDVMEATKGTVDISKLMFERENAVYAVTANAGSASTYAFLINRLLESEEILSITLERVAYEPRNRSYSADFKISIEK